MTMSKGLRIAFFFLATAACFSGIAIYKKYVVDVQERVFSDAIPAWERSRFPLGIHAKSAQYTEALRYAVDLINGQVGCNLLRATNDESEAVLFIKEGTIQVGEETEDWAAGAFVAEDMSRGEVLIWRPLLVGTDLRVIHHEIGHLFDLAHDRAYSMKPITEEEIGGRQKMVRYSDKDAAALRERYCD